MRNKENKLMRRTSTESLSGLLGLALAFTSIGTLAQQPQPASSSTPQSALVASSADASQPSTDLGKADQSMVDIKNPPSSSASQSASVVKGKKGKEPYSGPMTLVVLPPTPMLDEEGNQRQDPDGKLMFNPPVRQQRDKYGHPLFDEHGKKLHAVKEKPPKIVSVSISRGTLTIDGMTGKAALNYEIKDLKYVYFYVPGIGIAVVSNSPFPGAVEQKKAFDDKTLTLTLGEHVLQLSSDKRMLGKAAESAFVLVDKNFLVPTKFPVMGYGPIRVAPYAWPGSKQNDELKGAIEAPPLPADLRPAPLLQPCPAGQMRAAGAPVLPGQTAAPRPCVPIVSGETTTTTSANQTAPLMGNPPTRK
jgi:hypothetical protein